MEKRMIPTSLGRLAVFIRPGNEKNTPLVLLHGVYFDHTLWDDVASAIHDRTLILVDMPWHGDSTDGVPELWTLEDCGNMLIDLLDALHLEKVIAVGHSWGSMTILRAVAKHPGRFAAAGFCNMPHRRTTAMKKLAFRMQHMALRFRSFYAAQAAKALFGKASLIKNPGLAAHLHESMLRLTPRQIRLTDTHVILEANDAESLIRTLMIPALALVGEEDYVGAPPVLDTTVVPGGHVSPMEVPGSVAAFVEKLVRISVPIAIGK